MKRPSKSAPILTIISVFCLLLQAGCAQTKWPTWLTGEPDDSVLNAPRIVGTPPSHNDPTWPNLGSVPDKPKDFSTYADRKQKIDQMEADKVEAEKERQRIESMPMPEPLGPPPVLVPPAAQP
jgi:hypothetical protein